MLARVGLDCSFNSTGVCISIPEKFTLLHIASRKIKHSKSVIFQTYNRVWPENKDDFSNVDLCKVQSAENLAAHIVQQLIIFKNRWNITEWEFRIEGNLLSARFAWQVASISDMSMLNGIVKSKLLRITKNVNVYQATKIKKAFTNYGAGAKSNMNAKFMSLFPEFDNNGKVDDVIDSYALSTCKF